MEETIFKCLSELHPQYPKGIPTFEITKCLNMKSKSVNPWLYALAKSGKIKRVNRMSESPALWSLVAQQSLTNDLEQQKLIPPAQKEEILKHDCESRNVDYKIASRILAGLNQIHIPHRYVSTDQIVRMLNNKQYNTVAAINPVLNILNQLKYIHRVGKGKASCWTLNKEKYQQQSQQHQQTQHHIGTSIQTTAYRTVSLGNQNQRQHLFEHANQPFGLDGADELSDEELSYQHDQPVAIDVYNPVGLPGSLQMTDEELARERNKLNNIQGYMPTGLPGAVQMTDEQLICEQQQINTSKDEQEIKFQHQQEGSEWLQFIRTGRLTASEYASVCQRYNNQPNEPIQEQAHQMHMHMSFPQGYIIQPNIANQHDGLHVVKPVYIMVDLGNCADIFTQLVVSHGSIFSATTQMYGYADFAFNSSHMPKLPDYCFIEKMKSKHRDAADVAIILKCKELSMNILQNLTLIIVSKDLIFASLSDLLPAHVNVVQVCTMNDVLKIVKSY